TAGRFPLVDQSHRDNNKSTPSSETQRRRFKRTRNPRQNPMPRAVITLQFDLIGTNRVSVAVISITPTGTATSPPPPPPPCSSSFFLRPEPPPKPYRIFATGTIVLPSTDTDSPKTI